jgi:hypothetical protein
MFDGLVMDASRIAENYPWIIALAEVGAKVIIFTAGFIAGLAEVRAQIVRVCQLRSPPKGLANCR